MKKIICLVVTALLMLSSMAFASPIGGPRGFDFGDDGNLYISQGPTSAFPPGDGSFEGIAVLSGSGQIAEYASIPFGASTAPIMEDDGSFYVGRAGPVAQVRHYFSDGSLQSYFWLTSSVVNPSGMGPISQLLEGPNNNLYLSVFESISSGGLIQEYTKSGTLVRESPFLDSAATNGISLSFGPDGMLYASDNGATVRTFDENLNITSSQSFSQVNDLRDFYIDSYGNYLFTSRTPNEITGTFSLYNPSTNIWNQVSIDQGIPLEIIQIPNGTNFVSGNYFVGAMGDLPHYGSILEFDSNLGFVDTFSGSNGSGGNGGSPIPEPSSLLLMGFGGIITAFIKRRRKA